MKFTVADLLDQLPSGEPLPLASLEKALGLSDEPERQQLRIGLDALCRLELIDESEAGLRRQDTPDLIAARLRCSSKGFCFALRDDGGEDIYIRDHQLNHAWNGDRVLVRLTREGGRRRSPEGAVQCVLARSNDRLLAQVEQQEGRLVAVPLDDRLLSAIELPEGDAAHLQPEQESVVEVRIDQFPVAQHGARGHVARSLPVNGGEAADAELLLVKHRLQERPSPPKAGLRAAVGKERDDRTALPTLRLTAWREAEAPCLPALSLEAREEGGWRLWLHAPSVAERVAPEGALDLWLREQGESLCLGRRWLPLLPPSLSRDTALKAGSPAPALSLAMELAADGSLEHFRFSLTTIQVDGEVTPEALAALAERKPRSRTVPAPLKALKDQLPLLEQLLELGEQLRLRRRAAGSFELNLPMPELPSLGDLRQPAPEAPANGWLVALPDSHPLSILREAVLLAERCLGQHLAALELPALYAVQPPADPAALNEVAKAALALEIPLELSAEGNADAAELAAAFAATDRSRALQQQLREALPPLHLSEEAGPNGLAGEPNAFAPWCCPTLHYGDLWNQQVLITLLLEGKNRPSVRHRTTVDLAGDSCHGAVDWPLLTPSQLTPFQETLARGLAQRLNGRSRLLQELSHDVLSLAQARHAESLVGQTLAGVISGVQSYGFFVEVPPSQVEGLVHVSSLKDDWYEYRSRQSRLVGRKFRRAYMIGDTVEVVIEKVDPLRHQIDLAVIQPELPDAGLAEAGDEPEHEPALDDRDGPDDAIECDDSDEHGDDDGDDAFAQ
ncbi:MAG: RNB domain-containing ribonuclease [Synechococcaceae cyanobacterium]